MDSETALAEIQQRIDDGNSVTVSYLKTLANQVDVGTDGAQLLLNAGGLGNYIPETGRYEFSSQEIVDVLSDGQNTKTIRDTEIGKFLTSEFFQDQLRTAATTEGLDFNELYLGTDVTGSQRISNISFFDDASYRLVTTQLESGGDILPFIQNPANATNITVDSVFAQSEVKAILDFDFSSTPSTSKILGVDAVGWQTEAFNFSSGDFSGAQTYVADGLAQKSYMEFGDIRFYDNGAELLIDTTDSLVSKMYGLSSSTAPIPGDITALQLSGYYDNFGSSGLTSLSHYGTLGKHAAGAVTGAMDLFFFGVATYQANDAVARGIAQGNEAGGYAEATEIMLEWGGDTVGGMVGFYAGATLTATTLGPAAGAATIQWGGIGYPIAVFIGGVVGGIGGGSAVAKTVDQLFQVGRDFGFIPPDTSSFQPVDLVLTLPNQAQTSQFLLGDLSGLANAGFADLDNLFQVAGNEKWQDNFVNIEGSNTSFFIYENAMVIREANSVKYTYKVINLNDLVFDSQTGHIMLAADNSNLDFETNFSKGTTDSSTDNSVADFEHGTAVDGGNYQADMPINVINGDGAQNTIASEIVTDGLRPGNFELSGTGEFRELTDKVLNLTLNEELHINDAGARIWSAINLTGISATAPKLVNVDPLVLDIDNDGVELISFDDSIAFFDVDNDGYVESTGWINPDDAILVHDANGDGIINDITETISEYYLAAPGTGALYEDGLQALATLDTVANGGNNDGVFDANDAAWSSLRVWQDLNADAITDAGELKTLDEMGITSIDLDREIVSREEIEGNPILSRSTMMINGVEQLVASVDFATNPVGYEWNDIAEGLHIQTQDGAASSIHIENEAGGSIDLNAINSDGDATNDAQNVIGNVGDDIITGDSNNNWLVGGAGSDVINAGAGDDFITIDGADDLTNIDAGDGFDTVIVEGLTSVTLNLNDINAEVALGGMASDIIMSGGNTNAFIRGGGGDDVIIGGSADDALSGEDGDDTIDGGLGDDIIRGHRGEDLLIGDEGEDYLDGGLNDDELYGGDGEDLLKGGAGNDKLYGGNDYDVAEFSGKLDEYDVRVLGNGSIEVKDRVENRDGTDILTDVEALNFQNIKEVALDIQSPFTANDVVDVNGSGPFIIQASDILANDIDYQGDSLSITAVSDVLGGDAVLLGDGNVQFTPEASYNGVHSFKYTIQDSQGNAGATAVLQATGESAEIKGTVNLRTSEHPDDPLFYDQWYLSDANVLPVWDDYTGKGVDVGVFEPGVIDLDHPDLVDNLSQDTIDNADETEIDGHATLVAGVIAASKNNLGSVGVAYDATLSSHSLGENDNPDFDVLFNLKDYDIANNSWGFTLPFAATLADGNVFEQAAALGRGGLGTVTVIAAGNDRQEGDNANAHALYNNKYVISVGAINKNADLSSLEVQQDPFSNPGSNVLVSAPGSNITSTSVLLENSNGSTFGSDHETTQGTSFATPIVSGIVALMLEANPDLGYRDVQEILAYSSRSVSDQNTSWQTNAAQNWNGGGLHFSHDYGFGDVDALAAVRLAETWGKIQTFGNEINYKLDGNLSGDSIPDNGILTDIINISDALDQLTVEHVTVTIDFAHTNVGDLIIRLFSPNETEGVLLSRLGVDPDSTTDTGFGNATLEFDFGNVSAWGELAVGNWRLEVEDTKTGETGVINSWSLELSGKMSDYDDQYIYTDEFSTLSDLSSRLAISDNTGDDTINTAAISSDTTIDLNVGNTSNIDGQTVSLSAGTVIERAISGDGNDTLIGNNVNNLLFGGRGNDNLSGGDGDDWLVGAQGADTITGGTGKDRYVVREGDEGSLTIEDFDLSNDIISIAGFGGQYQMLSHLDVSSSGADTIIDLPDGQQITLKNISMASLNDSHLLFTEEFSVIDAALSVNETFGTEGNDTINGSVSNQNIIHGKGGDDTITGGNVKDTLFGGSGDDTIYGGEGDDIIYGGLAATSTTGNILYGNGGNDVIYMEDGLNQVYGGTGADRFVVQRDYFDNGSFELTINGDGYTYTTPANDIIFDFDPANDIIDLSTFIGATSFASLDIGNALTSDSGSVTKIRIIDGYKQELSPQNDTVYLLDSAPSVSGNVMEDNGYGEDTGEGISVVAGTYSSEDGGSVTISEDGTFTYMPPATGITGDSDRFTYTLLDQYGEEKQATVSILTQAPNLNAAEDEFYVDDISQGLSGNLLDDNGTGQDSGYNLTVTAGTFTTNSNGSVVINSDGTFTYTPPGDFSSSDSFQYELNDGFGSSEYGYVTITEGAAPARAMDDTFYVSDLSQPVTGNLFADNGNGEDFGDGIQAVPGTFTTWIGGTVVIEADGDFIYTAPQGGTNSDMFSYDITDTSGNESSAYVSIMEGDVPNASGQEGDNSDALVPNIAQTITLIDVDSAQLSASNFIFAENEIPNPMSDTFSTQEDTALNISIDSLLSNDIDREDDVPEFSKIVNMPEHGTFVDDGAGNFIYTPDQNFHGQDSFTYEVIDIDGGSATSLGTINVAPVNDAPGARDDNYTTASSTFSGNVLVGLGADIDVDGDVIVVNDSTITTAQGGTVTINETGEFTYNAPVDFSGLDTFEYSINDGNGGSDTATVSITVIAPNTAPVSQDDNFTENEDTTIIGNVLANDTDIDGDTLTVTPATITTVNGGSVDLLSDGSFTYNPAANFNGTDSFDYTVIDGNGGSDTGTVNLTINPVDDAPVLTNTGANDNEDNIITLTQAMLSLADVDTVAENRTFTLQTEPANGTLYLNGVVLAVAMSFTEQDIIDQLVTFEPNANFNGADSFDFIGSDGTTELGVQTFTINIAAVNDVPVGNDDAFGVDQDASVSGNLLANDSDVDGDTLSVIANTYATENGLINVAADGSFTYTPNTGYVGTDTFTYNVYDGHGGEDSATATFTVNNINDAPVAQDDTFAGDEDAQIIGNVLTNDTDPDGDSLSAVPATITTAQGGSVDLLADGSFTYTPAANFNGTDSFGYTIEDGNGGSDTGTVNLTVNAVNDNPMASDDSVSTDEDTAVTLDLLANDSDVDLDTLQVESVTQGTNGGVVINPDNTVTYTPDADFNGSDSFTYTINDGNGGADTATVNITVNAVNDAPVAQDDTFTGDEDTTITGNVLANDTDIDGDTLTVTPATITTVNGGSVDLLSDGSFTYDPDANFHGTDSFTYTINDGNGGTDTATVNVTVNAVNDAPIVDGVTAANEMVDPAGTLNGLSEITVSAWVQAGQIWSDRGIFDTEDADGQDDILTMRYDASGAAGGGNPNVIKVGITTTAGIIQLESASNVQTTDPQHLVMTWKSGEQIQLYVDGVATTPTYVSGPVIGTITGVQDLLLGHGAKDASAGTWSGSIGDFKIYDVALDATEIQGLYAEGVPANTVPVALDDIVITDEDTSVTFDVLANDSDANLDTLGVAGVTQGTNGSVVINPDNTVTYTPDANFYGSDSFTYTINDGNGGTDTATVNVTVNAVNDAPVAQDDAFTGDEDAQIIGNVLTNDTDPDSDSLSAVPATIATAQGGTVDLLADGSFTYTPAANFNGTDSFDYTVEDGYGGSDTGTVSLTVNAVNDDPVASDDSISTNEDTPITFDLLANDSDVDLDSLDVASVSQGANGSVVINPDGTVTYTPDADFYGTDSFTYTVTDGQGGSDTASVDVTVNAVNDAPVVNNSSGSVDEDSILTISAVMLNINDVDNLNNEIVITLESLASNGVLYRDSLALAVNDTFTQQDVVNGLITFEPATDYNGTDSFGYTVSDGTSTVTSQSFAITVNASSGTLPEILGTAGNDTLYGTAASERIMGMEGNDDIRSGGGDDILEGGDGDDFIAGDFNLNTYSPYNEVIHGGAGNDCIYGVGGEDIIFGDSGDDLIILGMGNEVVDGGTEVDPGEGFYAISDIVMMLVAPISTTVDLSQGTATNLMGTAQLTDIESVYGSPYSDTLIGDANNNFLFGGMGADTIYGGDGTDIIYGHTMSSLYFTYASMDPDYLSPDYSSNVLYGEGGNDALHGDSGNDYLYGGDGDDALFGFLGDDVLVGGTGSDNIRGGDGDDILEGGSGVDMLYGDAGADTFMFDDDALTASDNIQDFDLSEGDVLDVSDILSGYDPLTDAITDFVQITENGGNSYLSVDADGGADNFVQIAYLYNATGLTDEDALEASGNLIAA